MKKNKENKTTHRHALLKNPSRCALGRGSPCESRIALTNWWTQMEASGLVFVVVEVRDSGGERERKERGSR